MTLEINDRFSFVNVIEVHMRQYDWTLCTALYNEFHSKSLCSELLSYFLSIYEEFFSYLAQSET